MGFFEHHADQRAVAAELTRPVEVGVV
jgi:hypothetical protein